MTDFPGLLRARSWTAVEYILVGGAAATAHGASRLTVDLDVVYRRTPENIARLISSLAPHRPHLRGAPPNLPFNWDARTIERGLNFILTTSPGDIDPLGEIAGGGGYDRLVGATEILTVFGLEVRALTLERLIEVKRAAGRPRDLDAIAELEAIRDERRR